VAAAAAVSLTLVFAKVLSPQYLLWLVPLVPLVAASGALAAWSVFGGALLLTHAFFPSRYDDVVAFEPLGVGILVGRNALLVALAALLVRELALSTRAASRAGAARARGSSAPARSARTRGRRRAGSSARGEA
jgi:hypothetical protein